MCKNAKYATCISPPWVLRTGKTRGCEIGTPKWNIPAFSPEEKQNTRGIPGGLEGLLVGIPLIVTPQIVSWGVLFGHPKRPPRRGVLFGGYFAGPHFPIQKCGVSYFVDRSHPRGGGSATCTFCTFLHFSILPKVALFFALLAQLGFLESATCIFFCTF